LELTGCELKCFPFPVFVHVGFRLLLNLVCALVCAYCNCWSQKFKVMTKVNNVQCLQAQAWCLVWRSVIK
jgi:hypothetical protein